MYHSRDLYQSLNARGIESSLLDGSRNPAYDDFIRDKFSKDRAAYEKDILSYWIDFDYQ